MTTLDPKLSFYRTELRTIQNTCEGDNDKFLDTVAAMLAERDARITDLGWRADCADQQLRNINYGYE